MIKKAAIFTGQGAQTPGMGKDLYDKSSEVQDIFNTANSITGMNVKEICFDATADDLSKTINAQVGIFTVSVAIFELLKKKGFNPAAFAGFSLGEIAAYYAAGVFSLEDGFKIIKARACLMQQAAETNKGAMYAIIGLDILKIYEICKETNGYVIPVNYNCPGQIVIAGDLVAAESAANECIRFGAKKIARLAVNGAFHSEHMSDAAKLFSEFLNKTKFNSPVIPLYTNTTGTVVSDDLKKNLASQINHPVKWETEILNMLSYGIIEFYEIGIGKTLSTLIRRIDRAAETSVISTYDDVCNFN